MLTNQSKYIKIILLCLGVILLLFLGLNWFSKHKVIGLIESSMPQHINLEYDDLSVSMLSRSLSLENVILELKDSLTQEAVSTIAIKDAQFKYFGVWDYLFNETLSLGHINISNIRGSLKIPDSMANDSANLFEKLPIKKARFDKISIEQGAFQIIDALTDSVIGSIVGLNLHVEDLKGNITENNPSFSYNSYNIKTDSINVVLGPFNRLRLKSIKGTNNETILTSASLKTKFTPIEFNRQLSHQRDYYDVSVPKITVYDIPKSLSLDQTPLKIERINVSQPNAFVYRDKLLADDLSIKPMIGGWLRVIPLPFSIKHFEVRDAQLTYKERVHDYNDGGALSFKESNITINNLSNVEDFQPISIGITSKFAGSGEVKASWEFDILDESDQFLFNADVASIDLNALNGYCRPNFNTEMAGQIDQLYFTISGNKYKSHIDIKSNHSNIKISVLDRTHKNRNKFFSSVANLMISKNSKNKKSNYREASAQVERDMTKSGFNFIFKNVRKGMTKIFL